MRYDLAAYPSAPKLLAARVQINIYTTFCYIYTNKQTSYMSNISLNKKPSRTQSRKKA